MKTVETKSKNFHNTSLLLLFTVERLLSKQLFLSGVKRSGNYIWWIHKYIWETMWINIGSTGVQFHGDRLDGSHGYEWVWSRYWIYCFVWNFTTTQYRFKHFSMIFDLSRITSNKPWFATNNFILLTLNDLVSLWFRVSFRDAFFFYAIRQTFCLWDYL